MRRSFFLTVALAMMPANAFSQATLQDQISAVNRAYTDEQASEAAARKAAEAVQKARAAKAQARRDQEKKREEAYQDKLRQMQLDNVQMDLDAKKAIVNHADDYIKQDLKERAAETDVIQSNADATRNLSEGAKKEMVSEGKADENLSQGAEKKMESEGKADERKAKGFWGF